MKIKVKKINVEAIIPHYAHDGDAGVDLYSVGDYILEPGQRKLIFTGLKVEVPKNYEIQIRPKSGLALKYGITVLNTPGTVDSGYRGEVGVILFNTSNEIYRIKKGEKIAQAVIMKVEEAEIEEVDELSNSERGENGFGSTGAN